MTKNLQAKLTTIRRFFKINAADDACDNDSPSAFLSRSARNPALKHMMSGYAWFVPLSLWSNPVSGIWKLMRHRHRYQYSSQQPIIYFPHLKSTPWWPDDTITEALEQGYESIRKEFQAAQSSITGHPLQNIVRDGAWESILLYRDNKRLDANCDLFPRTLDIVERLPICPMAAGQVYFSVMAPKTHITAHFGVTNSRIRYHLGIETSPEATMSVAGVVKAWEKGRCSVFDDSFIHEVHHDGQTRRVVLIVDCWHPSLTNAERQFVTDFMRLLNIPGGFRART